MRPLFGVLLSLLCGLVGVAAGGLGLLGLALSDGPGLITAKVLLGAAAALVCASIILAGRSIRALLNR